MVSMIKKGMMTSLRSKVGALMVKPALKETLKAFDASEYGGAPLLGLKGLVVKSHGSAKSVEIRHAIFQCEQFKEEKINEKIEEFIAAEQKAQAEDKNRRKIKNRNQNTGYRQISPESITDRTGGEQSWNWKY